MLVNALTPLATVRDMVNELPFTFLTPFFGANCKANPEFPVAAVWEESLVGLIVVILATEPPVLTKTAGLMVFAL